MKSLKKTLVLLVVLSMILSAVSPVFAFSDVVPEVYEEQANKMAAFGVFTGDAEGKFNAENNITRAEMAKVIGRLMGLTENEATANKAYASNFSDVKAGEWYTGWVNLVAGRGIINGFPDGTFRPNENVTQAQAVTMIVKALGWGVVVDQSGTWPANYITKASELRLFKDAADSDSELVTRGNVAIYCYNALTAKMWDVDESTNGTLTSRRTDDTILAKYFADFVNEDGEMKLVEEAYVSLSGANTASIGKDQIKLVATVENKAGNTVSIASFIDADKAPKKDKELVTYKDGADVVAYVPAEVANIASLAGRKVDVIFGDNNEVAYIAVTDDSHEGMLVTAWDGKEIEIDGEEYELADATVVAVFGHVLNTAKVDGELTYADGAATITSILGTDGLNCVNDDEELTRNVIAEFVLDGKDEIESINFKFSANGYTAKNDNKLKVNEFVVEKISAKNVITKEGTSFKSDLDDYEDLEPRVIKNGEVAEVADIAAGDIVTEVIYNSKVEVLIVSTASIEGEVYDYLPEVNALEVDGTEYKVVAVPFYNDEGEIDEYTGSTISGIYGLFEDKEVTAYLNMAGEIVTVVAETEATGMILGVVTAAAEEDTDDDDVEYLKVRILAENGTEKRYTIYNEKSGKDIAADDAARNLAIGDVVMFSADEDRVIKSDKVRELSADATGLNFKAETDVKLEVLDLDATPTPDTVTVNRDDKKINGYRFSSSTVVINPEEEELISNWDALVKKNTDTTFVETVATKDVYLFTKGTKVVYIVAWVDETKYGASDDQYGLVVEVNKEKDEDDETIYVATILVDGEEETFECSKTFRDAVKAGTFIEFDVSDNEIDTYKVWATAKMTKYVEELTGDAMVVDDYDEFTTLTTATSLKAITVKSVEVVDGDTYIEFENDTDADLAKGYIVYSLSEKDVVDGINEGDYVLLKDTDNTEAGAEIVIVL